MKKIIINPDFNAFYYSYYIQGIKEFCSQYKIHYSSKEFPSFTAKCLAFIVDKKKIIIDCTDAAEIRPIEVEWCDLYGKVNFSNESIPSSFRGKVIPIGPSFGIKTWHPPAAIIMCGLNLLKTYTKIPNIKEFIKNYYRQFRYRKDHNSYFYEPVEETNYIFHLSSLWGNDPVTNSYRKMFIDVAKSLDHINFEGGFAPLLPGHHVSGFQETIIKKRLTLEEYIKKTKQSSLVFNTPAVYRCHGWKLAEYLSLGKAIISTHLSRELPAPLIHGKHIHFVEPTEESMINAINNITGSSEYRLQLERNARKYYNDYLRPQAVISRIIECA